MIWVEITQTLVCGGTNNPPTLPTKVGTRKILHKKTPQRFRGVFFVLSLLLCSYLASAEKRLKC